MSIILRVIAYNAKPNKIYLAAEPIYPFFNPWQRNYFTSMFGFMTTKIINEKIK